LLQLNQLIVLPGHQLLIKDITFSIYRHILSELGSNRSSRVSYSQGVLEIMTPLPEHEVGKVIIGDLIKALLEELDIEFWSLGSTTFDKEKMDAGVEPDDCFYIQNPAAIRGKDRIDLGAALLGRLARRSNKHCYWWWSNRATSLRDTFEQRDAGLIYR
jgi:Uma2 family endonuclease